MAKKGTMGNGDVSRNKQGILLACSDGDKNLTMTVLIFPLSNNKTTRKSLTIITQHSLLQFYWTLLPLAQQTGHDGNVWVVCPQRALVLLQLWENASTAPFPIIFLKHLLPVTRPSPVGTDRTQL